MLRGYLRVRKGGPSEADQIASLKAAGVDTGPEGPIYADGLTEAGKRRKKIDPADPLPQRTWATRHLRRGDVLVIHDEATLGTSDQDVLRQAAAIGLRHASILVATTGQSFRWHPEAAAMGAFAARAAKQLGTERSADARREAARKGFRGGRKAVLTDPEVKARALTLWGDPEVPNEQAVADQLFAEFKVRVSPRTIRNVLGMGRGDAASGRAPKPKKGRAK